MDWNVESGIVCVGYLMSLQNNYKQFDIAAIEPYIEIYWNFKSGVQNGYLMPF